MFAPNKYRGGCIVAQTSTRLIGQRDASRAVVLGGHGFDSSLQRFFLPFDGFCMGLHGSRALDAPFFAFSLLAPAFFLFLLLARWTWTWASWRPFFSLDSSLRALLACFLLDFRLRAAFVRPRAVKVRQFICLLLFYLSSSQ